MSEAESLIEYLADHDAWCLRCGYQLRGLRSTICSECGSDIIESELFDWLNVDNPDNYDALYEFGGIGITAAMVGTLMTLGILTITLTLYSIFTPGFFKGKDGVASWISFYVILIVLAGLMYWLDELWGETEEEFRTLPHPVRVRRAIAAWWWLWCTLIFLVVAPFL